MAAINGPHDSTVEGRRHRRWLIADVAIALLIAALLTATISSVGVLAPIVWTALSQGLRVKQTVNPRECAAIVSDQDRLACFDKYARGLMTPPAKGAFAPAKAFGQSHVNSERSN
jgi:hypothetical protein